MSGVVHSVQFCVKLYSRFHGWKSIESGSGRNEGSLSSERLAAALCSEMFGIDMLPSVDPASNIKKAMPAIVNHGSPDRSCLHCSQCQPDARRGPIVSRSQSICLRPYRMSLIPGEAYISNCRLPFLKRYSIAVKSFLLMPMFFSNSCLHRSVSANYSSQHSGELCHT